MRYTSLGIETKNKQMKKALSFINGFFGSNPIKDVLDKFFPDKAQKLQFEKELRELMFNELQLEFKDLESARNMQIEALKQDDKFSKRYVYILSSLVLINALFAGVCAFFFEFPLSNREFISQYYSFSFIAGGAQVISFFFGRTTQKQNNDVQ